MKAAFQALRKFALGFPETREDLPWGESAIKVRNKTFLFMRQDANGLGLSVKLPQSHPYALDYPFAERAGYEVDEAPDGSAANEGGVSFMRRALRKIGTSGSYGEVLRLRRTRRDPAS